MNRWTPFLLLGLVFHLVSCAQNLTATMTASVNVTTSEGPTSAIANINFTDFSQPPGPEGNDSKLRMRFTNPEGDQLDFVLTGQSDGIFQPDRYVLDESTNTVNVSFTIVVDNNPQVVSATTDNGYLDATVINLDENGFLVGFRGTFRFNFATDASSTVEGTIGFDKSSG